MYRTHKKMLVDVILLVGIHPSLEKETGNIDKLALSLDNAYTT
jgi:hypothetical protein